jgi:hypothetical protein
MYTSELCRQLSQVDLTRVVYKTPRVTLRCQGFNQITSMDKRIVGVGMQLTLLLWERVYRPLLSKLWFPHLYFTAKAAGLSNHSSITGMGSDLSVLYGVQTGSGALPASVRLSTGGLGTKADVSPRSYAEIRNAWRYISTPTYVSLI